MDPIVAFSQVTYAYPQSAGPAIRDVSFTISSGEFVALIGPTGAGKSTLCYCFNGAVPRLFNGDMAGTVKVAGCDTYQDEIPVLAQHVGLVVQNARTQLFNVTVLQEVAFGCENLGMPRPDIRQRVQQALEFVGLAGLDEREPSTLSGGQQQRVAIACVLAMDPEVLVLDEPTSELDPIGSEQVMEVIARMNRELKKTIFLVTHDMDFVARFATRVLVLNQGRLIEDAAPESVFAQAALLEEARIRPPQVCAVAQQLKAHGFPLPAVPITLPAAVEALKGLRRDR